MPQPPRRDPQEGARSKPAKSPAASSPLTPAGGGCGPEPERHMTVQQPVSPFLRRPLDRTEAQAADAQSRSALRWAKRLRRVTCTDRQGQPAGIDRRALMLAEAEMRDMLLDHDLRPAEVTITGRLTARQWCIAL